MTGARSPPFRFRHLLERARYFAEHARGVERDYLNFLSTFEREEALERTARQVVSLEKANIRIETQRVEQERLGIQAAKQSKELADLAESNSRGRLLGFQRFDQECDSLDRWSKRATIIGTIARVGSAIVQNLGKGPIGAFTAIADSTSAVSQGLAQYNELLVRGKQRDLEAVNLLRASKEAAQQAAVAQAQIAVAKEGLAIGTLQRSAAILRHEQAVTNADAMAGRLLNAEMWARLAQQMREVSETYLKRAVEIAFLAEQAYEFEADREVNVIRFDYDTSREASLLAADFLLADLDSLENDLLTAQTTRQQQIELVFSLANECPIALEELRREGKTLFSLTLERLERRFPGLYNLRIMSIDLRIDGLVDTRGFAAELTHFGSSMVRTKGPAATPRRRRARTWLWEALETIHGERYASAAEAAWPVRTRTFGPESWVFTGMSALERENVFGWTNVGQRNVFEGLGAAASFHLELSHGANSFDSRALYDVTLRLHLVGYADPALKEQVELAARRPDVRTQLLSVKQVFGDSWFEFQETGRLALQVRAESMVLHGRVGRLRNLGLILHPEVDLQSSAVMATGVLDLRVTEEGAVEVLYSSPEVRATASEGTISLAANAPDSTISFRVNDDLAVHAGPTTEVPAAEGATTITTLVARPSELSEHRTRVLVPGPGGHPLAVSATVEGAPSTSGAVKATFRIATTEPVEELSIRWQHLGDDRTAEGREAELELEPGRHLVAYTVVRKLVARVYSHQRHLPETTLVMNDLVLRTERRYEPDGTPTPGDENAFTQHLLGGSSISPTDLWHIDLRPEDNPALAHRDGQRTDVGWCSDVFLFLEYEVTG